MQIHKEETSASTEWLCINILVTRPLGKIIVFQSGCLWLCFFVGLMTIPFHDWCVNPQQVSCKKLYSSSLILTNKCILTCIGSVQLFNRAISSMDWVLYFSEHIKRNCKESKFTALCWRVLFHTVCLETPSKFYLQMWSLKATPEP